jgi:hypothetical protein
MDSSLMIAFLQRENKTASKGRKMIGKEISWYIQASQIYWLQVQHTGDYLLNDLKMLSEMDTTTKTTTVVVLRKR